MDWFIDYRVNENKCANYYLRTVSTGGVTAAFALLLILSSKEPATPASWLVFGITLGLESLVWGAYNLNRSEPQTRWGTSLMHTIDTWFPPFLFMMRKVFLLLFFVLLWSTLQTLGLPSTILLNTIFTLLLITVPIKGIIQELHNTKDTQNTELLNDVFRYMIIILSTLLSVLLISAVSVSNETTGADANMPLIVLWLAAFIIILTCILMFFSRLPHHKPDPSKTVVKNEKNRNVLTKKTNTPVEY